MDLRADEGAEVEPGSRWMTHVELAEARGISTASVIKLALRHGWRKQKDNRGAVRCLVPPEFANARKDSRVDRTSGAGADAGADKSSEISVLQFAYHAALEAKDGEIAALKGQIVALSDGFVAERAALRGEADLARADVQAARQTAEAADGRRQAAEVARDEERARADQLKELLEATQVEMAEQQSLTDQAEAARREAIQAVEQLRQADAARKARGLLARLKTAWRGE